MEESVTDMEAVVWLNSPKDEGWRLREVAHNEEPDYPYFKTLEFHVHGAIFAAVLPRCERRKEL